MTLGFNGKKISNIVEMLCGADALSKDLEQFRRDVVYFGDNYEQFRHDYPDQWVAILEEKVVGHGTNLGTLIKQMQADGINTGKIYVQRTYLNEMPPNLILERAA